MPDTALQLRHEPMRIAGRKVDADPLVPQDMSLEGVHRAAVGARA